MLIFCLSTLVSSSCVFLDEQQARAGVCIDGINNPCRMSCFFRRRMTILSSFARSLAILVAACSAVHAQPSPDVQRRISAAIQAAIVNDSGTIDYTAFVNLFIGTGTFFSPTE